MGKKIDELDVYGSYDVAKMGSDIFEVSKNSGTEADPIYAPGDSKKIKLSELAGLVGAILPGGYIPLVGPNYLVVTLGTNIVSGTNLVAAIAYAKAATPNGSPLSASNRFSVILFPGVYNCAASNINALGEFVDIIGVGDPKDIIITSNSAAGTIKVSNSNDYILKNLTIKNTTSAGSIVHNNLQTDNGIWDNLILYSPNTVDTTFSGSYEKITGLCDFILCGSITGSVKRSTFLNYSCGRSIANNITISGTIEDVDAGNFCCGNGKDVTISGTLRRVKTGTNSMGCSNIYGNINFTSTAIIEFCTGTGNNFGRSDGNIIIDCKMFYCLAEGGSSFGSSFTGGNCTIGSNAHLKFCEATFTSFCHAEGTMDISGLLEYCIATTGSFGNTSAVGKLIHCQRTAGFGIHLGIFEDCDFSENSALTPVITIDEGAILTRSRFTQNGAGDCIVGANITADITYCYMNKPMVNVANSIPIAYNIGDIFTSSGSEILITSQLWQNVATGLVVLVRAQDTDSFESKPLAVDDIKYTVSEYWVNEDNEGVLVFINETDELEIAPAALLSSSIKQKFWQRPDGHIIKITIDGTNQFKFVDLGL